MQGSNDVLAWKKLIWSPACWYGWHFIVQCVAGSIIQHGSESFFYGNWSVLWVLICYDHSSSSPNIVCDGIQVLASSRSSSSSLVSWWLEDCPFSFSTTTCRVKRRRSVGWLSEQLQVHVLDCSDTVFILLKSFFGCYKSTYSGTVSIDLAHFWLSKLSAKEIAVFV